MAVAAYALTTLTRLKTALGVSGSTDDTLLETIIDAASVELESRCARKFVRRDFNDGSGTHSDTSVLDEARYIFDGDGISVTHILPHFPSIATGFVLENLATRTSSGDTWTTLTEGTDFIVDYEKGIIHALGNFTKGVRNYRVTYAGGYLLPTDTPAAPWVPDDLEKACQELCKIIYRGSEGIASENIAGWSRSFVQDKSNTLLERVVSNYRSNANLL
tara:strand:+ start:2388 stop:3041 length:654 start_codon:yes stop_codon:yes gene_type:complete